MVKKNEPTAITKLARSGDPRVRVNVPQATKDAKAAKNAKKNAPSLETKMTRSGDPRVRAEVPKVTKAAKDKKQRKEAFLRLTGLVIVGVMGATLLVSAIGGSL